MTGNEIHNAAAAYINGGIDENDALIAINEAMTKLGDMALVYDQATGDDLGGDGFDAGEWYDLPANLTNIVEVLDSKNKQYSAWTSYGNTIRFADTGTYTIVYRRMPIPLAALTADPEIHVAFHPALVTYVKAWHKLREDDKNADGQQLKQEFYAEAERVFKLMRRGERRHRQWKIERAAIRG
jgi:hypothetical protein